VEASFVTDTGALQKFLAIVLFWTFPISLFGADKAILNANGTATLVNGSRAQRSSALFAGDKVETAKDSVANINVLGSSVLVMPNSAVRFQGDSVAIDHGKISIVTSKGMVARTGDLTIAPAPEKASRFDVSEDNGRVLIAARKGNLTINGGKGTSSLQEGQQTTVDNSQDQNQPNNQKNRKRKTGGAVPAAAGGASVSGKTIETGALIAAGATGTAAAVLAIVTTGTPNNCSVSPVSPAGNGCK
jgi:hypothetical protein